MLPYKSTLLELRALRYLGTQSLLDEKTGLEGLRANPLSKWMTRGARRSNSQVTALAA